MFKVIIFDFDGVVVDTEPLYERAESRLFREYGIKPTSEDWKHFKGVSDSRFFQILIDDFHISEKIEILRQKAWIYLKEEFQNGLRLIPGFKNLIEKMYGKYRFGLVTSTRRAVLDYIFRQMSLPNYFHEIVTVDDVRNGKPHPEPYLLMFSRLGVSPYESVVIEDSIHGVASARKAGAAVIGLTSSLNESDLKGAHLIIHSLNEVTDDLLLELYKNAGKK
jgi:beta-phosphoglucomutase